MPGLDRNHIVTGSRLEHDPVDRNPVLNAIEQRPGQQRQQEQGGEGEHNAFPGRRDGQQMVKLLTLAPAGGGFVQFQPGHRRLSLRGPMDPRCITPGGVVAQQQAPAFPFGRALDDRGLGGADDMDTPVRRSVRPMHFRLAMLPPFHDYPPTTVQGGALLWNGSPSRKLRCSRPRICAVRSPTGPSVTTTSGACSFRTPGDAISQELGVDLPEGVEIVVHESNANTLHLALPVTEIGEEQLEAIAAGRCCC